MLVEALIIRANEKQKLYDHRHPNEVANIKMGIIPTLASPVGVTSTFSMGSDIVLSIHSFFFLAQLPSFFGFSGLLADMTKGGDGGGRLMVSAMVGVVRAFNMAAVGVQVVAVSALRGGTRGVACRGGGLRPRVMGLMVAMGLVMVQVVAALRFRVFCM